MDRFTREHNRCPVLAVDAYTWYFETKHAAPEHRIRIFFDRLCAFRRCGIQLIMVFDGQAKRRKLRWGSAFPLSTNDHHHREIDLYYKEVCRMMGVRVVTASSEGEAECVQIEASGVADFVFTNDTDALVYGARNIIRYPKKNILVEGAFGEAPKRIEEAKLSGYDRYVCVTRIPPFDPKFSQNAFIMYAILQGDDYDDGTHGIGTVYSYEISFPPTRFADRLIEIYRKYKLMNSGSLSALPPPAAVQAEKLKRDILVELRKNTSGYFRKKISEAVAAQYISKFPNWKAVDQYLTVSSRIAILKNNPEKAEAIKKQIDAYHASPPAIPPIDINRIWKFCSATLEFPAFRFLNSIIPTLLPYIISHDSKLLEIKNKKSYREGATSSFFRSGEIVTTGVSTSCTRAQRATSSNSGSSFHDNSDIKLNHTLPDYYNIILTPCDLFKALNVDVCAISQSSSDFQEVINTPWKNIVPEHVLRACKYGYIAEHEARKLEEQAKKLEKAKTKSAAKKRSLKTSRCATKATKPTKLKEQKAHLIESCSHGENSDTDEDIFAPINLDNTGVNKEGSHSFRRIHDVFPSKSKTNFLEQNTTSLPMFAHSFQNRSRSSFIDLTAEVLEAPSFKNTIINPLKNTPRNRLNEVISLETDDSDEDLFAPALKCDCYGNMNDDSMEVGPSINLCDNKKSEEKDDFCNDDTDVEFIELQSNSFKENSLNVFNSFQKTDILETLYGQESSDEKAIINADIDTDTNFPTNLKFRSGEMRNESQSTLIEDEVSHSAVDASNTTSPSSGSKIQKSLFVDLTQNLSDQNLGDGDHFVKPSFTELSILSNDGANDIHKNLLQRILKRKAVDEIQDLNTLKRSNKRSLVEICSMSKASNLSSAISDPNFSKPQHPNLPSLHEREPNEKDLSDDNLIGNQGNCAISKPADNNKKFSIEDLVDDSLSSSDFDILEQEMLSRPQTAFISEPSSMVTSGIKASIMHEQMDQTFANGEKKTLVEIELSSVHVPLPTAQKSSMQQPKSFSSNNRLLDFGNDYIREEKVISLSDMEVSFSVPKLQNSISYTVSKTVDGHELIEFSSESEN